MKTTRRIASVILTLAMLLSLVCVAGTVSAGAASKKVSMYSCNVHFSKYGGSSYEVCIQTWGNAKDEEVYVHYNYLDSMDWQDAKAELYTTLSDGSKIWKAYFSSFNTKYCVKYIANGKTYWDNNHGKDYDGTQKIGSAPISANRLGYQYTGWYSGLNVEASLQNYAYHKNVFVRYTTDNWHSYRDAAMSYDRTNSDGTENWTANLDVDFTGWTDIDQFEYAICYRVNGREYWANNFGENYDGYYYIHH